MIPLVEGMANTVKIKVNASIDIEGFSAVIAACGVLKTIPDISVDGLKVEYSAEEVAAMSDTGTYGTLEIYDADGKFYIAFLPQFQLIPNEDAALAIGNQTIYVTIASTRTPNISSSGSGGDPSGYATKEELNAALQKIASVQEAVDHAATTHITSHIIDVDADGKPDDETIYFHPETH